jgi:hypothetical protein
MLLLLIIFCDYTSASDTITLLGSRLATLAASSKQQKVATLQDSSVVIEVKTIC